MNRDGSDSSLRVTSVCSSMARMGRRHVCLPPARIRPGWSRCNSQGSHAGCPKRRGRGSVGRDVQHANLPPLQRLAGSDRTTPLKKQTRQPAAPDQHMRGRHARPCQPMPQPVHAQARPRTVTARHDGRGSERRPPQACVAAMLRFSRSTPVSTGDQHRDRLPRANGGAAEPTRDAPMPQQDQPGALERIIAAACNRDATELSMHPPQLTPTLDGRPLPWRNSRRRLPPGPTSATSGHVDACHLSLVIVLHIFAVVVAGPVHGPRSTRCRRRRASGSSATPCMA
jgi:hypothetical protein